MELRVPCKKSLMEGFLASGYVQVFLDPRKPGVVLPASYLKMTHLRLDYGSQLLTNPAYSISLDAEGIRAMLSMNGMATDTFVPWSAVFYLEHPSFGAVVWKADEPVLEAQDDAAVDTSSTHTTAEPDVAVAAGGARQRPSWLKLVS